MPDIAKYLHDADEYADALRLLLPTGPAWPLDDSDTPVARAVRGFADIWGAHIDPRAADFLVAESDPRLTLEMLGDWESAFGLPDRCWTIAVGYDQRRATLIQRMTIEGAQSRAFFIGVAADLGYTITIEESSPFMCGISPVGDPEHRLGPEEMRFFWYVSVNAEYLRWFRVCEGEVGVDHHLEFGLATDLECIFNRWKPAHTKVIFDYSEVATPDSDVSGIDLVNDTSMIIFPEP